MSKDRLHFAMPRPVPPGRFRRVPPAVFPPLMGALGLALAWQGGVWAFSLPPGLAGLLAGMAVALALCAFVAYGAKLARRPAVLAEELETLPGRAGVSAAVLCLDLLAALLAGIAPMAAMAVLVLALLAHGVFLTVLLRVFAAGPAERRQVTPAWHLHFTGLVVAARSALLLDLRGLGVVLMVAAAIAALAVYALSAMQLRAARVPAPLRPMLAIHLAPLALFGAVALELGATGLAMALGLVALAAVLAMAVGVKWLTESGFSALWGAFTFPLAATAGLWVGLWGATQTEAVRLTAGFLLIGATFVVIVILFRIWRDWANGRLAVKSNAAIA